MTNRNASIFRDPVWQSAGVIISIIGICLGLFSAYDIFFRERVEKDVQLEILANTSLVEVNQNIVKDISITYKDQPASNLTVEKDVQLEILANTSLVEVNQNIVKDISITYKDQPASNLTLVDLKLSNSGNQPIKTDDYIEPIRIVFPRGTKILEASILDSNPSNIGLKISIENEDVLLSPVLLNENETVTFRLLVIDLPLSSPIQAFTVNARIVGISQVKVLNATGRSTGQQTEDIKEASGGIFLPFQTILVVLLVAFIVGLIVGVSLTRPRVNY